ncbi:FadR/GntR family transcriptional regulator [Dietzia sp. KRD202]|uniref:FadR/GntR family transcriptional regulator n=1 Tax=Dietzia sp. KRD202 TaxID=2729732 RepID=UPI001F494BC3|nr:FCD domain-containing protein [Dietzia sp. KRD202]
MGNMQDEDRVGDLDEPAYSRDVWERSVATGSVVSVGGSRAEHAAGLIARIAAQAAEGERLGSKEDLRKRCGVSVGAINEAIKLAQTRGVITSRPGPGGGLFARRPSPVSKMNGWFRAAVDDDTAFDEAVRIRDAIAGLIIEDALQNMTSNDDDAFQVALGHVRSRRREGDPGAFLTACWNLHADLAAKCSGELLRSLYLSIMDVGTNYVRAKAGQADPTELSFDRLEAIMEELVVALAVRDHDGAVSALTKTVPTVVLEQAGPPEA